MQNYLLQFQKNMLTNKCIGYQDACSYCDTHQSH